MAHQLLRDTRVHAGAQKLGSVPVAQAMAAARNPGTLHGHTDDRGHRRAENVAAGLALVIRLPLREPPVLPVLPGLSGDERVQRQDGVRVTLADDLQLAGDQVNVSTANLRYLERT